MPDMSVPDMRSNVPESGSSEARSSPHLSGDALERDLSRVAAWMQKDTRLELGTHPSRAQRPLQIRLDVAAVERDTDMISQQADPATEQPPGLLSHYLRLADIDQQRERLGTRQCVTGYKDSTAAHRADGSARQHVRSALFCSRMTRSKDEDVAEAGSGAISVAGGVALPGPVQVRQPTLHKQQKQESSLMPFSETDLTQFLPYALSTPGVQTAIGSPALSRANSTDDFADWLKRNCRTLDATAPSPPDGATDAEASVLNERRKHLLEGIHKLLLHQRFLCRLAQAMMQFGAPLHHLEDNLSRMARHLCITATFTTMPGLVLISVEDATTSTSETKIIRCPNGYDMHRLELTDRIFRRVSKDKISVEEAMHKLEDVLCAEPLFAWYWQLLNWGLASWSVCILAFNGSWLDSLAAFVLGIMAGCLNLVASRLKGFTNLFEVTVSILTGFITTALGHWLCFGSVTLSATVVLLPGLLLTTGVIELTSRNMHAGTIRTTYALAIAFIIAFGLNLGNDIFVEIFSKPERLADLTMATCSPVSQWWWWLAFPVSILSICFIINVHPKNWHACVLVAGIMFAVFWVLVIHLGLKLIGPVVSAFVLGLSANIWSKVFGHNAYATMLPGMMILVPGSVGVRGIMTMINSAANSSNTQLVAQMIQTSLSIMVGLFASSCVIYPRGKKQSALLTV
ncbi:pheromone-regulated protein prm10 [Coemansia sp. BCRC 34301]|nr:pheromone-regulated protein prm10 [Coemansia sp. BCRC 34301]